MQRRKLFAGIVAILIVGLALPAYMPRAHAFYQTTSLQTSGYTTRSYYDSYLSTTVDGIKAGSTLTFTVTIYSDPAVYQRNISMGVKFDWMSQFQNASNASPSAPYALFANQAAYLTLTVNMPALSGQYSGFNLQPHYYTLEIWSTPTGQPTYTGYCPTDNAFYSNNPNAKTGCLMYSNSYYYTNCYGYCQVVGRPIAIYNDAQASIATTSQQAAAEIGALQTYLSGLTTPPPGTSGAAANLAAALVQQSLASNAYKNGDFATAQTDYQNALNDANAAQSSLATTGGGTDVATMTNIWLTGAAVIMGGIGALLLGFGGFKYMRGKTRSMQSYTPATTAKP